MLRIRHAQRRIQGGALGVKPPPLGPVKSIDFRGFSAPPGKRKKFKPPLDKFLNTPLDLTLYKPWTWPSINPGLLKITFEILSFRAKFHISVSFRYLLSRNLFCTFKGTVSGKITLRTKMALLDWQRYPWKLCLKYDLDIKVFCLFKLFISFAVSLRKWLAHFLFIKSKGENCRKEHFFWVRKTKVSSKFLSDYGFKGTVVNRALPFLFGG